MSTADLFVEAVDTAITLGWALLGWLVFLSAVAAILTLAAIATGATVVRGVWRHTAGPSWGRSALRAQILARTRSRRHSGRTEPQFEEAA